MEGKEGGKSRMIPWWWALVAWVIGEIMGGMCIIICMGSWDTKEEQNRKDLEQMKLIYPENKKAADAGTSTAAHMGRKDYFL